MELVPSVTVITVTYISKLGLCGVPRGVPRAFAKTLNRGAAMSLVTFLASRETKNPKHSQKTSKNAHVKDKRRWVFQWCKIQKANIVQCFIACAPPILLCESKYLASSLLFSVALKQKQSQDDMFFILPENGVDI